MTASPAWSCSRLLDKACSPAIIEGGVRERLARSMHDDHRARTSTGRVYDRSWERLTDEQRESSRRSADGVLGSITDLGLELVPLRHWGTTSNLLTDEEVAGLAEREHERWRVERESQGWTYGPERDDQRQLNPELVDPGGSCRTTGARMASPGSRGCRPCCSGGLRARPSELSDQLVELLDHGLQSPLLRRGPGPLQCLQSLVLAAQEPEQLAAVGRREEHALPVVARLRELELLLDEGERAGRVPAEALHDRPVADARGAARPGRRCARQMASCSSSSGTASSYACRLIRSSARSPSARCSDASSPRLRYAEVSQLPQRLGPRDVTDL